MGIRRPLFDREVGNAVNIVQFLNAWTVGNDGNKIKWKIDSPGSFTTNPTFMKLLRGRRE